MSLFPAVTLSPNTKNRRKIFVRKTFYAPAYFAANSWIPVENIDIIQMQKDYILKSGRNDLIGSIKSLQGEDLQVQFNIIFHNNHDLAEEWSEIHLRALVNTAVKWLKANKISYHIDHKIKKCLD